MRLIKRYFDVIEDTGRWATGYDIALETARRFRYRELRGDEPGFNRSQVDLDQATSETLPIGLEELGVRTGCSVGPPGAASVAAAVGPIAWRIDAIGFRARLAAVDDRIEGPGYRETVVIDDWPWRLGLRSQRWGRFIGRRSWAVWHVVDGEHGFALVGINGIVSAPRSIARDRIAAAAGEVSLGGRARTVHEGDVLRTDLAFVAPLVRLLAGRGFRYIQHKYVREARLKVPSGGTDDGLAMDEAVTFAKT